MYLYSKLVHIYPSVGSTVSMLCSNVIETGGIAGKYSLRIRSCTPGISYTFMRLTIFLEYVALFPEKFSNSNISLHGVITNFVCGQMTL
jgi:hypothetical protein